MLDDLLRIVKDNNFNEDDVSLSSDKLFNLIIELKRFDLINLFDYSLFTTNNMLKIINLSEYESDLAFLKIVSGSKKDRQIQIQSIINKGYYNIANDYFYDIYNSPELFDQYLNNIGKYNSSFKNIEIIAGKHLPELLNALSNAKRFDLMSLLLEKSIDFDDNSIEIINNNINEIIQYINTFKLKVNLYNLSQNPKLFESLFLNGFSKAILCINYYSAEKINDLINNSTSIKKQILEYLNTEDDEYIDTILSMVQFARNDSSALQAIINRGKMDKIKFFERKAWNIENQQLCIKLIIEGKIKKEQINNNSLLDYYISYDVNKYVRESDDIYDVNNILTLDCAKKAISRVSRDSIDNYVIQLYEFVIKNNSNNICRLVYSLLEGDMNNAKRLIDDNGVTDYFKSYLKYDRDYIINNPSSISDENPDYLFFKELATKYSNTDFFNKYLMINDNTIDLLINNGTFTRQAIELLLSPKGVNYLTQLLNDHYKLDLTELELSLIDIVNSIPSEKQKKGFIDYYNKHKSSLTKDNLYSLYSIFERINNTNSFELRKQADNIIPKLLLKKNPIESYDKLEYTLTSGAIPEFYKRFVIYKELYGDIEIKDDPKVNSPILRNASSREEADRIILMDLFNISVANNSQDLIKYLDQLNRGNELYCRMLSGEKTELQKEEIELLHDYRIKYEYIAEYIMNLEYDKSKDDFHTIYNIEKAYCIKHGFQYLDSMAPYLFENLMFKEVSKLFPNEAILRVKASKHSILRSLQEELINSKQVSISIEQGDLIKGINSDYLENTLSFGILSKEFLGEDSQTDETHLDTDMSLIERKYDSIKELMESGLTGTNWGDMSLILSRDYMEKYCDLLLTKDNGGEKELLPDDYKKMELFAINGNHYCIRTGAPTCCIKGIVASRNFDKARFLVSKSNNYIPIYDREGNLLYSYEDYENDKSKMAGLSYYGNNTYTLSKNLINEDIADVLNTLNDDTESTKLRRDAILKRLQLIFDEYFSNTRETINNSVLSGTIEIFDIGSTGRNTNVPNDGDFDFILRVDRDFMNSPKFKEFISEIYSAFGYPTGDAKKIRLENVNLKEIEIPLKVEITIIDRNSKMDYSTDMCLKDRLTTIQRLYPNDYNAVKANIIFAKEFFKKANIYKTFEHGFGGVGVENFVLQHGGSFTDAIEDFLKCADSSSSLQEFKKKFHIYDYGKNHFAFTENNYKNISFPYDDYSSFLDDKSYEKMKNLFREYLSHLRKEKMVSDMFDSGKEADNPNKKIVI